MGCVWVSCVSIYECPRVRALTVYLVFGLVGVGVVDVRERGRGVSQRGGQPRAARAARAARLRLARPAAGACARCRLHTMLQLNSIISDNTISCTNGARG